MSPLHRFGLLHAEKSLGTIPTMHASTRRYRYHPLLLTVCGMMAAFTMARPALVRAASPPSYTPPPLPSPPPADTPKTAQQPTDYLGLPGPILLGKKLYHLVWSAHPTAAYVKQEYIPADETIAHYDSMLLIERISGPMTVEQSVNLMALQLQSRKTRDPLTRLTVVNNQETGNTMLDFLISGETREGPIVEWNAYRYAPLTKDGGVVLFGLSRRAYGQDGLAAFMSKLSDTRQEGLDLLTTTPMPQPHEPPPPPPAPAKGKEKKG
ncbi:Hypothetical protein GbCGDNIH7_1599 [Granulibacter bethesdensis]|nr:Hypothetical protein GbCGDNIH7_1599 [Granulibacter bethesdensis]